MNSLSRFPIGASVVWRSVSDRDRAVHTIVPLTVVRDDDFVALYLRASSTYKRRRGIRGGPGGRLMLEWDGGHEDRVWHTTDALVLHRPGDPFSVRAVWRAADRQFLEWYVNLEQPWRRTPIGFDSRDRIVDIVISADRDRWTWKDEGELAGAVQLGDFTQADINTFRADGERAVRAVIDAQPPFSFEWKDWVPDPAWPVPTLPDGWDRFEPASR